MDREVIVTLPDQASGRVFLQAFAVPPDPDFEPYEVEGTIEGGILTVPLLVPPLTGPGFWQLRVYEGANLVSYRNVLIPFGLPIPVEDLADVNPATLESAEIPPQAWQVEIDQIKLDLVRSPGGLYIDLRATALPPEEQLPGHLYVIVPNLTP